MKKLNSILFFLVPFWCLGLFLGDLYPLVELWSFISLLIISLCISVNKHRSIAWVLIWMSFLSIAAIFSSSKKVRSNSLIDQVGGEKQSYLAVIKTEPSARTNSIRFEIEILADSSHLFKDLGAFIYFSKESTFSQLQYGDTIEFHAQLERPRPIQGSEFDYPMYLFRKEIYFTGFIPDSKCLLYSKNDTKSLEQLILIWRKRCLGKVINWKMGEVQTALAAGILLGIRQDISSEIKDQFARIGVIHVLAVSGLHLGIWYMCFIFLFSHLPRTLLFFKPIGIICLLWFIAFLTGGSPSVIRAAAMFSLISLNELFSKGRNSLHIVALSAIVLTSINPYLFFQLGFQLSYSAILGIVLLYPWLNESWSTPWLALKKIKSLSAVSISAQIATAPLSIYTFHRFPYLFLPANLIVVPMVTLLVYLGFMSLILDLTGMLPPILIKGIELLINAILWVSSAFA